MCASLIQEGKFVGCIQKRMGQQSSDQVFAFATITSALS